MEIDRIWPDYRRFCETRAIARSSGLCEMRDLTGANPTTLLPLADFLRKAHMDEAARVVEGGLCGGPSSSILRLQGDTQAINEVGTAIADQVQWGRGYGGRNAFIYLMGELMQNVHDHSDSDNAFIMAQESRGAGFVEMSVLDDGITVAGSLRRSGIIFDDDIEAIAMAMNGLSSKREGRRGFGLRTSVRICVRGLRGRILTVSGRGAVEIGGGGAEGKDTLEGYSIEDKFYHLEGTLVSVRIPLQEREVDIYGFT
ncbi:MAG: hypothetical protein AB1793_08290 [Candidatus Thermoplasmatota archaeon]